MGVFGQQLPEETIYQTSYMGFWIKVYPNRVDFKSGLGSQSIPINQIASVQLAMMGVLQITLETTGGKKYSIPTTKKAEVQQAIYDALARSAEISKQQANVDRNMPEQWGPQPSNPGWQQPPTTGQQQWGPPPSSPGWQQQSISSPGWQQTPTGQQQWGQQPSNPRWQQQPSNPGPFQPLQQQPQKWYRTDIGIIGLLILFFPIGLYLMWRYSTWPKSAKLIVTGILAFCVLIGSIANAVSPTQQDSQVAVPTQQPIVGSTQASLPTATPTPTPSPTPTQTAAQIETQYKASTTSTTVANLDKDGTADQGKDVHFICTILNFVKDSTGATAGANVSDPGTYSSSVVQIIFPNGTDITRLNQDDTLEIWGNDQGVFSGTNAFGGTVQEVGIDAAYLTDQTTNYQAGG